MYPPHLEFLVVLGLSVHLNLNCINLQQLCSFFVIIRTIFVLTWLVKFLQDLTHSTSELLTAGSFIFPQKVWILLVTLFIRPYSPLSNQIWQSFKLVLNHSLCKMIKQEVRLNSDIPTCWMTKCLHKKFLNLIFSLFKSFQGSLIELLQEIKVVAGWTRNKIHNIVYALLTVISCHRRFDVGQHLPICSHHLFVPSQPVIKLHSSF